MDKLQWFKFTPSDWMMGKIQRCPEITQARFMRLCCLYWNKGCNLSIDDAIIEIDKEHFDTLTLKKIISKNDFHFNISFLDEQFLEIQESSSDKSKSGIIGNLKRWHLAIYNDYVAKKISLNEAIKMSKVIAPLSHTDSTPIAPQSQNIADKIREDKNREDEIRKDKEIPLLLIDNYKAMPLLSLSSKEFEDDTYLKTALGFYSLFEKNLLEQGAKTTNLKKAKGTWVDDIRLIIEADEYDLEDLRLVFNFLQKDDFWKKQILSTSKLRKQMEKLIIQAKNPNNGKTKRNITREQFEQSIDKHFQD